MTPWQIALTALAGFLLLLFSLLLLGRARLSISYDDRLCITLSIFGIKKTLIGSKGKTSPKALKDLTDCKNPEKEILRARKREQKRAKKAKKKQAKAAAKKAKQKAKRAAKKQKHPSPRLSIGETLSLASHLIKKLYEITKGKFRLHIKKLHITVGSADAATTAILYGSLSGLAAGLLDFLDSNYIPVKVDPNGISIAPDFTNEDCSGELSLTLSTPLWRALRILLKGGVAYLREKAAAEEKSEKRLQKESMKDPSASAE